MYLLLLYPKYYFLEVIMSQQQSQQHMFEQCNKATAFLKLLANPNRLMVLCSLQQQRFNVTELAQMTGLPQAAMSTQLALLREAGLVDCEVRHRERLYYINDVKVTETIQLLHKFFCAKQDEE